MGNEELIIELIYAYNDWKDFCYRSDYVDWSLEKEERALKRYQELYDEVLARMRGVNE